ncbi:MAG: cobalt ECF transporter T component CbiQ [Bacillota bacterium]
MEIPQWLSESEASMDDLNHTAKQRRAESLLEKALKGLERFLSETLSAESTEKTRGFWQALDPRVKVVTVVVFIALLTAENHLPVLVASYGLVLILAVASRVPLVSFLARTWGFTLIFAGVMVLPLTLNRVTPGAPLLILLRDGIDLGFIRSPGLLAVTDAGLLRAAVIVLRTGAATSLALLLTFTTPWTSLLKALRAFRIPRLVILILEITLRYVFLLVKVAVETLEARKLRMVGPLKRGEKRAFFGAILGTIASKSYALHEAVYEAMLTRGYTGEPRLIDRFRLRAIDYIWTATATVIIGTLYYLNRF